MRRVTTDVKKLPVSFSQDELYALTYVIDRGLDAMHGTVSDARARVVDVLLEQKPYASDAAYAECERFFLTYMHEALEDRLREIFASVTGDG